MGVVTHVHCTHVVVWLLLFSITVSAVVDDIMYQKCTYGHANTFHPLEMYATLYAYSG